MMRAAGALLAIFIPLDHPDLVRTLDAARGYER